MNAHGEFDQDLELLRQSLHRIDDDKIVEIQKRRRRRSVAQHMDGDYSLLRLIDAQRADNIQQGAPYEWQCSQRISEEVGRAPSPGYAFVPIERRDLDSTTTGAGKEFIYPNVGPGGVFAQLLDELSPFRRLGIQELTLVRPANFPAITTNFVSFWQTADGATITEDTGFTLAIQASTPKTVGAFTTQSDRFLRQSGAFGQHVVLYGLARSVVKEMLKQLLVGPGTLGRLRGIYGYPGINTVSAGTGNYEKLMDMVATVEADSAVLRPSSCGFVMPSAVAKLLRSRERAAGSGMIMLANDVSGYQGEVVEGASPNVLTFGHWSQLLLLQYGMLEIGVDPYGASGSTQFRAGQVTIRALWTCDFVLLNPTSFCTSGALS